MKLILRRDTLYEMFFVLLGLLITWFVFNAVYENVIYQQLSVDYKIYNNVALRYSQTGINDYSSYILYQVVFDWAYDYSTDVLWSALVVTVASYLLCFVAIYWYLREVWGQPDSWWQSALIASASFIPLFFAPVFFFEFTEDFTWHKTFTYLLSSNWYHNPTINMLRPFSVLVFGISAKLMFQTQTFRGRAFWTALGIVISLLATQAKPSYAIVILPAIGLYLGLDFLKHWNLLRLNWWVIVGTCIPTTLMLAYQYFAYEDITGTYVRLFGFYRQYGSVQAIIPHFFLSIAFPLYLVVAYWRQAWPDAYLRFAWAGYIISLIPTYLLVEKLENDHGNFAWSGEIAGFVLAVASTAFFLKMWRGISIKDRHRVLKLGIGGILLVLHLVSGLLWYEHYLTLTR